MSDLYTNQYLTPISKIDFAIYNVSTLTELERRQYISMGNRLIEFYEEYSITVTDPNGKYLTDGITTINELAISGNNDSLYLLSPTEIAKYLNEMGIYTITYKNVKWNRATADSDWKPVTILESRLFNKIQVKITVVENRLPLKKWTITDVIKRLLDVAEPLRKGENPRFKLNDEQAAKFDKILSPEFSFTKQTLRECLQEIGKVVHGEPRLTPKNIGHEWYYEVSYDMYASQEESGIYTMPYVMKTVSQVIDSYAAYLDSNAENLVNQLDKYGGVIVEPYAYGAKTVRTENMYVRISEDNMIIPTQYPIYAVDKLEYVYAKDEALKTVDITPWLFEKSIYDSQLASYKEQYPYSKAYGLYYSQGNNNIGGLNFKVDSAILPAFKGYAIVNILRQATGNSDFSVSSYPEMAFRVTYTPFYNARVAQTKVNYKDFTRPAALIFNQASNVIESRYYGENLKGAIARIGNVDLSLTYVIPRVKLIPKAGQMYDKNYYISSVAVEMLPTCFLVTIGLSKDFNRLSQYIGINSTKRYSEISQTQAVERNTLWREYIVIGEQETPDDDCLIGDTLLYTIMDTFMQFNIGLAEKLEPLTNVVAWGTSYKENSIATPVNLPVISSAFGNSISFSWRYEDNYSAGGISEYKTEALKDDNGNTISGYFQNSLPYTDYYGRIYYYGFDLQKKGDTPTASNLTEIGESLPKAEMPSTSSGFISTIGKTPYILRKDNRETLQCNFQIDFVTNTDIIIGSALASYCPAVRGANINLRAKLYVFPTELNKFTDHIEAYETDVRLKDLEASSAEITVGFGQGICYVTILSDTGAQHGVFPANGKSWAIVTNQTEVEGEKVEDEFGKVSKQTVTTGGDLLIGKNQEVTAGQTFTPIYFTKKREIFDKTVWKETT